MKFKVGDRVRIRTDLKIFEKYGSQYFVRDMKQHEGKIAIITRVFDDYYIHIDLGNDDIALPFFKKETMYKGMKADKEYTLKELGLDE